MFTAITNCNRCGSKAAVWSLSWFNTDIICPDCREKEIAHPRYPEAREAERAAEISGNYNFPGIGLPDDLKRALP